MKPSVNRMVHYMARGSADGVYPAVCRAAVVSEVNPHDGKHVGLVVLNPTGLFFHSLADGGCWQDEEFKVGGTWHWAERVDE